MNILIQSIMGLMLLVSSAQAFQLEEATIASIHDEMLNQKLTCEALTSQYIERIKNLNFTTDTAPPLNAFTVITPDIIEQARVLDQQFKETGKLTGPLHCIPVIVKDNIDTIDSTSTSGTLALLGSQPIQDAFLVTKLRQAGALIIGKGGMDEMANGIFGYSSRTGRIGNAYDASQNPGGSSSGSAVAVSANFAMAGIGTDNSGSIRVPAAFNGLVGLRPSTELINREGIFPGGMLDSTAGPLARTVTDLALILDTIATTKANAVPFSKQLTSINLKGKHVAVINSVAGQRIEDNMTAEAKKAFDQFYAQLDQMGATISIVDLHDFDINREHNGAGEVEDVNEYLASFPSTRRNYADICTSQRIRYYKNGERACLEHIQKTPKKGSSAYQKAQATFKHNREYVENLMHKNNYDVLLIPISRTGIATYDAKKILTWQLPVSSNSGLPAITIPIGYIGEKTSMPVGIEIIGHYLDEMTLLNIAYTLEKTMQTRKSPVLAKPDANNIHAQASILAINNFITEIGAEASRKIHPEINVETLPPETFRLMVEQQ